MSLIPKINIGVGKDRQRHNLSFDSSTTANIGQVQPTMCRELVPGENVKVQSSSFVRLSPVAVPTFGRMSLRNYHCFVPYNECWDRFNNFISAQKCAHVNGSTFIPEMSYFNTFAQIIFNFSDVTPYKLNSRTIGASNTPIAKNYDIVESTVSDVTDFNAAYEAMQTGIGMQSAYNFNDTNFIVRHNLSPDGSGCFVNEQFYAPADTDDIGLALTDTAGYCTVQPNLIDASDVNNIVYAVNPVTFDAFDYAFYLPDADAGSYVFLFRLKPIAKRFRSLVMGLGYAFTPFESSTNKYNPLKLIAFYKAYFSLFAPIREKNFESTACSQLMQYLHENSAVSLSSYGVWINFLEELLDIAYYLPVDYFSMSTAEVQQSNSSTNYTLTSPLGTSQDKFEQFYPGSVYASQFGGVRQSTANSNAPVFSNPLLFKVAQKFLTYANKNTVIGRSVRDYLKAHYGYVDEDVRKVNGVELVGTSRTNVQISEVMSNAEVPQGSSLGEYAGKGNGYANSETFDYNAKEFGCYIVISTIVPESGYNQGYLRENRQIDRFDFPTLEFDALGYQTLERGEIMDSYISDFSGAYNGQQYDPSATFGFVPRYSHHKVARNIVTGDLSLPSLVNAYSGYTFDRAFPVVQDVFSSPKTDYNQYGFMPNVVFDGFRKLDMTDVFGNYNRIFNYTGVDMDHFIIHQVFDVSLLSPLKSLSNSFDTYSEGDDTSVDVSHS